MYEQLPTRRKNSTNKPRVVRPNRYYLKTPKQAVITYHMLDHDEARNRIQEFVDKNPGARTSKVIDSLRIDPEQVSSILEELESERLIYSRDIGSK